MRVLWTRGPSLAGEVAALVNKRRSEPLAYTTVLAVLTNLEAKGVVNHTVEGRAYRFAAHLSEAELRAEQARIRAKDLLGAFAGEAVSAIVAEVRSDPHLVEQFRALLENVDEAEVES